MFALQVVELFNCCKATEKKSYCSLKISSIKYVPIWIVSHCLCVCVFKQIRNRFLNFTKKKSFSFYKYYTNRGSQRFFNIEKSTYFLWVEIVLRIHTGRNSFICGYYYSLYFYYMPLNFIPLFCFISFCSLLTRLTILIIEFSGSGKWLQNLSKSNRNRKWNVIYIHQQNQKVSTTMPNSVFIWKKKKRNNPKKY